MSIEISFEIIVLLTSRGGRIVLPQGRLEGVASGTGRRFPSVEWLSQPPGFESLAESLRPSGDVDAGFCQERE